jgi:IS30 family transposase
MNPDRGERAIVISPVTSYSWIYRNRAITFDNGKEFAGFKELERGTNENKNGLPRQFFPKGMDFRRIRQSDIDRALALLDNRPRKCLTYRTPTDVFWSRPMCCASD